MGATPWDGEVLAAELDDQRGPRAFVHEPGGFEPVLQQQGGETFLCVNDHLGMPKDLVSGDGLVVWTAAHSAYGRVIAVDADLAAKARYGESASVTAGARGTATGIESPFRLLGQIADEDAELGWTRFRCFDAETGRWLSPDPIGADGGTNLIAFDGAPTLAIDPLGLSTSSKPHTPAASPVIKPEDLKDKTPDELRKFAKDSNLVPDAKKPDKWKDPVTGKERLRIDPGHIDDTTGQPYDDPKAAVPHVHGYEPDGKTKIRDPADNNPHFPTK